MSLGGGELSSILRHASKALTDLRIQDLHHECLGRHVPFPTNNGLNMMCPTTTSSSMATSDNVAAPLARSPSTIRPSSSREKARRLTSRMAATSPGCSSRISIIFGLGLSAERTGFSCGGHRLQAVLGRSASTVSCGSALPAIATAQRDAERKADKKPAHNGQCSTRVPRWHEPSRASVPLGYLG